MSAQNYHKIFLYIRETKAINWIQNKEINKQKRTTKGKCNNTNVIIFNLGIRRGTEIGKDRTLAWHTELHKRSWGMRAKTVQQGHNKPGKSRKSFCCAIHLSVWAIPYQPPQGNHQLMVCHFWAEPGLGSPLSGCFAGALGAEGTQPPSGALLWEAEAIWLPELPRQMPRSASNGMVT